MKKADTTITRFMIVENALLNSSSSVLAARRAKSDVDAVRKMLKPSI